MSLVAPSAWRRSAARAWSGVGNLGPEPGEEPLIDSAVVHAIGRPVKSWGASDWLEVSDRPPRLLGSSDLTAGGATLLTVLQGSPYIVTRRTATDREDAACLKRLAHGVFVSGTWAVVTIPSLPPSLATQLMEHFAQSIAGLDASTTWSRGLRRLRREDPVAAALRRAHSDARRQVRNWSGWEPDVDLSLPSELADDICLFIRTGRQGLSGQ